jgi:DNA invertase Pin-like site-specific DNA recombinase
MTPRASQNAASTERTTRAATRVATRPATTVLRALLGASQPEGLPLPDGYGKVLVMGTPTRAIAYGRVSTGQQVDSGLSLDGQRDTLNAEIQYRGWELVDLVIEEGGESGKDLNRPGIRAVLDRLAAGEADALVVTRSTFDCAALLEWARRLDVRIVALDLGLDTSTSTGRMVVTVMSAVAEWEREAIADRTRDALATKRAQGGKTSHDSVRSTNKPLADRIAAMRAEVSPAGRHVYTWQAIADTLNSEGIPTVRGGTTWRVSAVQAAAGYLRPPAKPKHIVLPEGRRRRSGSTR